MPIIDDHGVEASVDDELAGDLGAVGEADAGDEGGVCFLVWRGRWVGGWRRSRRFECVAVSYGWVGGWVEEEEEKDVHLATVRAMVPSSVCTIIVLALRRKAAWTAAEAAAS